METSLAARNTAVETAGLDTACQEAVAQLFRVLWLDGDAGKFQLGLADLRAARTQALEMLGGGVNAALYRHGTELARTLLIGAEPRIP